MQQMYFMVKKLLIALAGAVLCGNVSAQVPTIVHDVSPSVGSSDPKAVTSFNNALYFTGRDMTVQRKLWKFDGTNTTLAVTIDNSGSIDQETPMVSANGRLFFSASKNIDYSKQYLWYYTGMGSAVLLDTTYKIWSSITEMVAGNNKVYFFGTHNNVLGLYSIDAVNSTFQQAVDFTPLVVNTTPISFISEMVYYNNKIYFVGSDYETPEPNAELFVYDPSNGNTTQVISSCPTCDNQSAPANLHIGANNKLYYSAMTTNEGRELYEINGSNTPVKLTALNTFYDGLPESWGLTTPQYLHNIVQLGNYVYFSGSNGPIAEELMRHDLVNNTTTLVKDIFLAGASNPVGLVVFDNKVYFLAGSETTNALEIMSSNGTTAGTVDVTNTNNTNIEIINSFMFSNNPPLTVWNNHLYFAASHNTTGTELYRLAGTNSIEPVSKVNNINVYPVPAKEEVFFDLDLETAQSLNFTLTDVSGKEVYNSGFRKCTNGRNSIKLPVQQLAHGIYHYSISSDKGVLIGNGKISH